MENIYNELNRYLKGSSRFGINENIARFLLTHLEKVPSMRLAEVAEQCHVSTPSVIRFCRELGYADYTDFKDAADRYLWDVHSKELVPYIPLCLTGSEEDFIASLEQWTDRLREEVLRTMTKLDRKQVERLAREILQFRYVYLFGIGLSGLVCDHLRIMLARVGKLAVTPETPKMDVALTPNREDTLALVFSQHGRYLKQVPDLLDYLRANCRRLWLVTQETPQSLHPKQMDEVIYLYSDEENIEIEHLTMLYFQEMLSEYCTGLEKAKQE